MGTKEIHEYAWNWFEYHAGQRLTAFRYYLVFLGIFAVALNNGLESDNYSFVSAVAALGAFVSVAFLVLEFRNEKLVDVGREALRTIEESQEYPRDSSLKLVHVDRSGNPLISHKIWLRLIYLAATAAFALAAYFPSVVDGT